MDWQHCLSGQCCLGLFLEKCFEKASNDSVLNSPLYLTCFQRRTKKRIDGFSQQQWPWKAIMTQNRSELTAVHHQNSKLPKQKTIAKDLIGAREIG